MNTHPYYQRKMPAPQDPGQFASDRIDLGKFHLPPYPQPDESGNLPDSRPLANSLFDARAAAAVIAAVGYTGQVKIEPPIGNDSDPTALLERVGYGEESTPSSFFILSDLCLAVMAAGDYFPSSPDVPVLQALVSDAIREAWPESGWCGTSGPGWDDCSPVWEGNYDMRQMFLLPLAYAYYDQLRPDAREKLITQLLAHGNIDRCFKPLTQTSGPAPDDWYLAGECHGVDIPETENHVLMIATARYLTNQLLFQRDQSTSPILGYSLYDNRRNGCMDQLVFLLRMKLSDDFAEYNAKTYQEESRNALLNLYSYAYDAEIRLGAGMVLDYVSAHIAVSTCDLRRMVPFRRRNENRSNSTVSNNVHQMAGHYSGFMDISLLESSLPPGGADPMPAHFALHAGNTRAYQQPDITVWPGATGPARPLPWMITPNFARELVLEAVCDHRLAPSVHDLFVNDLHRRFYQRLHRYPFPELGGQRNCENKEIYAGSPSYLISAGGEPAGYVIPGFDFVGIKAGWQAQNLGVAVPISFMPTSEVSYNARDVIQIMHFSDQPNPEIVNPPGGLGPGGFGPPAPVVLPGTTKNYGVAPDFACGVSAYFGFFAAAGIPEVGDGPFFAERRFPTKPAGYYVAVHRSGDFVVLEAFDTWRHPLVSFDEFQSRVSSNNPTITLASGQPSVYTTFFGNRIHYVIWNNGELDNCSRGSKILQIEYADGDPSDTLADAGNDTADDTTPAPFLSGTIMRTRGLPGTPGAAVVDIHNPALGTTLTLDWSDPQHLVRISENGEVQQAGAGCEVWVDFDWTGPMEGDFYRPFNTLEGALDAVAEGGVIRIMAGAKQERLTIHKRVRLTAAGGAVTLRSH